jgi:hypothetical protein
VSGNERVVFSLADGDAGGKYWAIATWDGGCWQVRIEDHNEIHRADTTAPTLAKVGPIASMVLAALFGCHPDHVPVSVEIHLPTTIIASLSTAEGLVAQARPQVESAMIGLQHAKVAGPDIAAILAARSLTAGSGKPRA